ncbi:hypothetical protein IJ670_06330 [bacterium]|nr:hypothetical protein [bacterium]
MKLKNDIVITFKNKDYKINPDRLIEVISRLLGKEIEFENEEKILQYVSNLKLYDEIFLKYMESLH